MGENFPSSDNKKCKQCGKESPIMVNGLCLDCYDIVEEDLNKDVLGLQDEEDDKDDLEKLEELYDERFNRENLKEDMIIHGRAIKDPDYDRISRERTISRLSHRNKPNIVFKGKKK